MNINEKLLKLSTLFQCLTVFVFLTLSAQVFALPAANWRCIAAQGNDVVLNWTPVNDPGGVFVRYEIHSVQDGQLGTETNINNGTFTDLGVTQEKDYFIVVVDNIGGTTGDTLKNIRLDVTNPGDGTALLNWNTPGQNISNPNNSFAYIYRSYDGSAPSLYDSIPFGTTFYRDTIRICSAVFDYQIQYPGDGCDFTSNIWSELFEDKMTPSVPVISYVTIDPISGDVTIDWDDNDQEDTFGYLVYKLDPQGNLVIIDTVWGIGNSSYTYTDNTSLDALTYSVAAFDSCLTQSAPATFQTSAKGTPHTTVFLEGSFDECLGGVFLEWSEYVGWGTSITYTVMHRPQGGGAWTSENPGTNTKQTIYFPTSGTYEFVIQTDHIDGRVSHSNIITIVVVASTPPSINYLASASVNGLEVDLHHYVQQGANISAIAFERKQKDGTFKEVGRVDVTGTDTYYTDISASVDKINLYRAVLVDICGNKTIPSNEVETIYLTTISDKNDYISSLNWTPYIGFENGVQEYSIYQIVDGEYDNTPIAVVDGTTTSFVYDLDEVSVHKSICYQVVAEEITNSYGFADFAGSNDACGEFEKQVFIPNAFSPNGYNREFKPEFSFNDYLSYEMQIYNRWGKLVHKSNDGLEGWNGDLNNGFGEAPPEVYHYIITFTDKTGVETIFRGHLTLIR